MLGDLADVVGRLRAVIPTRWFSDQSPNLSALLTGLATPFVWLFGLIQYAAAQTRLSTSTGFWLDLFAYDYFSDELMRAPGESDLSFSYRIKGALFQEAATRSALASSIMLLTGEQPTLFEPARPFDTGAYGGSLSSASGTVPSLAYGQRGGWGSLKMPYQFFVSVPRPPTPRVANLAGYTCPAAGYGRGQISYVDRASLSGNISDDEIRRKICKSLPVNATAWLRIV